MASTGGRIVVLWDRTEPCTVTITGGTFKVDGAGGDVSFPIAVTSTKNYVTTADGVYAVTVAYRGVTVASFSVTLDAGSAHIFRPEPTISQVADAFAPSTSTTTLLESVAAAINTTGKYVGKMVWNTTTGLPLWADTAAANGTWSLATGVATHTPV